MVSRAEIDSRIVTEFDCIGSLIARILFQPLEESSRLFYSSTLTVINIVSLRKSVNLLALLLILQSHLALIFNLLVPSYSTALIYHLLGTKWSHPLSTAPVILKVYLAYYIPLIGLNGITEAFFQSVGNAKWLRIGSYYWTACSIIFITLVITFNSSEINLIKFNCYSMILRIAFSTYFIKHWFSEQLDQFTKEPEAVREIQQSLYFRNLLPKLSTLIVFGLSSLAVRWSEEYHDYKQYKPLGNHLLIGVFVTLVCLVTV